MLSVTRHHIYDKDVSVGLSVQRAAGHRLRYANFRSRIVLGQSHGAAATNANHINVHMSRVLWALFMLDISGIQYAGT